MVKKLLLLLGALALVAVPPALADSANGSSEHTDTCVNDETGEEQPAEGESCPEGWTFHRTFHNQVTCGPVDGDEGDVPDVVTPAGTLYTTGDPEAASGGVEVCADGDADNTQYAEQLAGWARVDVGGDGVAVSCGADDGNLDSTHPDERDGQEHCG